MNRMILSLLFLIVTFTWGTTWVAMRIAVNTIPPVFATGMRFLFAAPLLLSIAIIKKIPLLFPPGQRLFQFVICIFYFSIPFSLMIYGEKYVGSGLAAIIFSNMPVAVLIASCFILNKKTNIMQVTGLSISIGALAEIIFEESAKNTESHWPGVIALIIAVVIHAIIYTQCKKRSCTVSVITFNALPCLLAAVILLISGWFIEKPQVDSISVYSILATIYLGCFAGVFGIVCYFELQKKSTAFQASLVFLIFPLIAITLERYIYGNTISVQSMICIIPLVTGIFITLYAEKKLQ